MARKIFINFLVFLVSFPPSIFSQSILRSSGSGSGAVGATGATGPSSDGAQVYGTGSNTTLPLTIAAAGTGGTVAIPDGSSISIATAVTISASVKIKCGLGVTLTKTGNVSMFTITGSNVSVEGCAFNGANGSFTGKGITVGSGASHVTIKDNTFSNMDTSSIYINGGGSDIEVKDNRINPWNSSGGINIDGAITDARIHDNYCDGSNEVSFHKCIQAHATSGTNVISGLQILNNTLINGEGYCVEVGKFGGQESKNILIQGNKCTQAQLVNNNLGGFGGYSIDTSHDVIISNNTYINETSFSSGNPGLELIGTQYNASGNVLVGSYATMNRCVRCVLNGNTITQSFTDNPALIVEIQPGATTQPPTATQNNISNNIFILSAGGVDAVYQFCNTGTTGDAVSFCTDNIYEGNTVIDILGTATGAAFRISGVKGTILSTYIKSNKIINFTAGKCYNLSTNATGVIIEDNREGCSGGIGTTVASNPAVYRGPKAAWTIGDTINLKGGSIAFAALATPTAPTLTAIATGGTLNAATTYAYRISAVNASGETVSSTETTVTTAAGANTASVYVFWPRVIGAVGYNVYGRTSAGELKMTPTALDYDVSTFLDTGSVTPSGALPASNTTLGSLTGVSNINGFYPPASMGSSGQVATSNGAGTPATFQTISGLLSVQPRPNSRMSSYMAAGNTTLVGSGESLTVTGTASNAALDSVGNAPMSINWVTAAATSGTVAGITGKTSTKETRSPLYQAWAQLPASGDFVVTRMWVTWGNSTFNTNAAGSDDPAGNYVGFRASTVAGDTNWKCVANVTSGTQTLIDSGIAINTTGHRFEASVVASTSITWKIDNVQVCTTANNATGTGAMATVIQNITQENVVKNLRVAYVYWEQDVL